MILKGPDVEYVGAFVVPGDIKLQLRLAARRLIAGLLAILGL